MTHDEMIAVIAAHRDGKKIECRSKHQSKWSSVEFVMDNESIPFMFAVYEYRVAPEHKLRPWTANEVPLDCWIRLKGQLDSVKARMVVVGREAVTYVDNEIRHATFDQLLRGAEHSGDGGKTWAPCGVEVSPTHIPQPSPSKHSP